MKNISFKILIGALALMSSFSTLSGQTVSKADAQSVATHFFQQHTGRTDIQLSLKKWNTSKTTSTDQPGYNELFLFEPTNGLGFVLVSSNKNAPAILAFSDYSNFDVDQIPPQAKYMIDQYAAQIADIHQSGYKAEPKVKKDWDALQKGTFHAPEDPLSAGPLLTTTWDQDGAYNQFCPRTTSGINALTGCVATSMAQIMRYWRFPNGSNYHQVRLIDNDFEDKETPSSPNTDMVTVDSTIWLGGGYDWNNMPNAMEASSPTDIARLMLHAGFAVGMDYGVGSSGAFTYDVPAAMHDHFGFASSNYVERSSLPSGLWHEYLRQSLDSGVPVIYRAPGHAWVCDGYSTYFGSTWYNMNWGWGGSNNGYYDLNALSVNGNNYNNDQCAVFGLVPPGCPISDISTGVGLASIEVARTIIANSTIAALPGLSVTFDAGESITLLPDFVAPVGCNFTALIEGCGGDYFNREEEAEFRTKGSEDQETQLKKEKLLLGVDIAPNPFSDNTTITYSIQGEQQVAMHLMDATGKLVATPMPPQTQVAGEHQFNLQAGTLPAGMYFLVLQLGEKLETRRLILSK